MNRNEKQSFVEDFRKRLTDASVMFLTDFSGLDVKSMTVLRNELRKSGAEYMVVKNRLARRALEGLNYPDLSEWLAGPTGVVLGHGDSVGAAKAISEFAKAHNAKPAFKVGVLSGTLLTPEQIEQLAKLPPREELLAMLAGALQGPLAAFAAALEAKIQELAGLLTALKEKKEGGA